MDSDKRIEEKDIWTFKICIFGNATVGKTTLVRRLITGKFFLKTQVTIGIDIGIKAIEVEGNRIIFQIWDFGGEERFRFLLPSYSRGALGGIFMFDITKRQSLENLNDWLEVFTQDLKEKTQVSLLMVGGKNDLNDRRAISKEEAKKVAKDFNFFDYIECSSKTGENVNILFKTLAYRIMKKQKFL